MNLFILNSGNVNFVASQPLKLTTADVFMVLIQDFYHIYIYTPIKKVEQKIADA